MSRFYGVIQSERERASTRCGHRTLTTHAAGWRGAVRTTLFVDDAGNENFAVQLIPWRGSAGETQNLARGILDASVRVADAP